MSVSANNIRNLAVVGHSGEGKTTLCEAILFNGGSIERMGKTDLGTTVSDFDEQEISRKISVSLSVLHTEWQGTKLNLLDVPGFYDFEGEFNGAMRACGAVLVVVGANGTVTVGAEKAISLCLKAKKPLIVFINGMDKDNADYNGTVNAFREKYHGKIAPIQLPIMEGGKMAGVINALTDKAYRFSSAGHIDIPVPAEYQRDLEAVRFSLMETAAEQDDVLLEKYFEDGFLSREDTIHGIRKGIFNINVIPVMAGSALQNRGVINLMNEIVKYMPQAAERRELPADDLKKDEVVGITCDENGPLAAQVFKTAVDPFVGKLNYLRVNRGVLKSGMTVLNPNTDTQERISSLYIVNGKKQEAVSELRAGDIGAVAKLANTGTGDTLCDVANPVKFDPISFPKPVLYMAVSAKQRGQEDKVFAGLNRISEEDPTFTVTKDMQTGETLAGGMGEVHLDIVQKKLKSKFGAEAELKLPLIPYKETIRGTSNAEGKYKKQTGGHGQYGHCKMRFEPTEKDFEFAEEIVGGTVPKQYIPAVEKGIVECLNRGVLAGYPVIRIKATLYDGSYHDVDSSEAAFKAAAELAFREGMKNASPVLLEPISRLRIAVPEQYLGDVLGDLNKRRGRILGMDAQEEMQIITAEAPKAEVLTYATSLRSMTQGRGRFTETFSRYEQAPDGVLQSLNKA
ncbi:MAG: elongation factor G [Clostridiales bacterium]|nr:elongation factor G [Clostridiales bacterium]